MQGKRHPNHGREIHTSERRAAFSNAKLGDRNPNFGKPLTQAHKEAITARLGKCVEQLDAAGAVIETFASGRQAERILGLPPGSVSRVCSGEYEQFRGFVFRRASVKQEENTAVLKAA
jgi:hypothetical protein